MSMMVSFVLSFFPRDVLDEILKLIESVSEDFPSYSFIVLSSFEKISKGFRVIKRTHVPLLHFQWVLLSKNVGGVTVVIYAY